MDEFLLKCFFISCILMFFGFVWWFATEPGTEDDWISQEELRRIEREAAGCEDAADEEDVVSGHPATTFLRKRK